MVRVIQGNLRVNRSYRIYPMKHAVRITSIEVENRPVNAVAARTEARVVCRFVSGKAASEGITAIEIGSVLAKGPTFPRTAVSFTAMVTCVPSITSPFMPGYFDLHIHGARVECAVTKLLHTVDPQTGDTIRKSPQFVSANSSAVVQIATRDEVTIEDFSACAALGRFVLRDQGRTVAVGKIQSSKPARQAKK
jgi:translation elongation factor EF-1alpha